MKLLYFEMRKSWLRLPIFIALAVLSALSVLNLYGKCRSENSRRTGDGKAWYWSAYTQYRGEITESMITEFLAYSEALSAQYNSGNYDLQYDDKYITGYLAGDNVLLNIDIKNEIAYAVEYPKISDRIASKAFENVELYNKIGMSYEAARNRLICQAYQNRRISEYRTTFWAEVFFNYDFSSLLCVVMLIAGLSACYTGEKDSGMKTLIRVSNKTGKTDVAKIVSAAVYCAFLSLYFTLFDLLSLDFLVGVDGMNMPVYSVETLQRTPFGFSLLSAIFLWVIMRFIAIFSISLIILYVSKIMPNTVISIVTGFALSMILMFLSISNKGILNPFCALNPGAYIAEFLVFDFLGYPILISYAVLTILLIEIVILILGIVSLDLFSRKVRLCFGRK